MLALGAALIATQAPAAGATDSSSNCPSGTAASPARTTCTPSAPDATQAQYQQLEARLGGDVAKALAAEQRLSSLLDQDAATSQALSDEIAQEEATIASLESEIAVLDAEIADTQQRITVEKAELSALVRAIYRQPSSFLVLIARTGSLRDALVATADLVVAGERAHALQAQLEADLAKLQADEQARQQELDQHNGTLDLLNANLSALQEVMSAQSDISGQLSTLVAQLQAAKNGITGQPANVTASLADLLEAQEQDLVLRSYQEAWNQAQVGTGLAIVNGTLPLGKSVNGLALSWPMLHFQVTQPFGPTTVLLEPAFGPYPHFHTGIDMAAPLGTPVMAAAAGVVVAVGHTAVGYGNYVVVAHGGGIQTLYGHLLATTVTVGQSVVRGQEIGMEGSTGFSTGPHCHFELRVDGAVVDPMPYLPIPGTSWSG